MNFTVLYTWGISWPAEEPRSAPWSWLVRGHGTHSTRQLMNIPRLIWVLFGGGRLLLSYFLLKCQFLNCSDGTKLACTVACNCREAAGTLNPLADGKTTSKLRHWRSPVYIRDTEAYRHTWSGSLGRPTEGRSVFVGLSNTYNNCYFIILWKFFENKVLRT
jgi:hypothetical protein